MYWDPLRIGIGNLPEDRAGSDRLARTAGRCAMIYIHYVKILSHKPVPTIDRDCTIGFTSVAGGAVRERPDAFGKDDMAIEDRTQVLPAWNRIVATGMVVVVECHLRRAVIVRIFVHISKDFAPILCLICAGGFRIAAQTSRRVLISNPADLFSPPRSGPPVEQGPAAARPGAPGQRRAVQGEGEGVAERGEARPRSGRRSAAAALAGGPKRSAGRGSGLRAGGRARRRWRWSVRRGAARPFATRQPTPSGASGVSPPGRRQPTPFGRIRYYRSRTGGSAPSRAARLAVAHLLGEDDLALARDPRPRHRRAPVRPG
jgi:hypothetical protein